MQEMVYKTEVRDAKDLCKRIMQAWNDLDQRIIDSAVLEWWHATSHMHGS